MNPSIIPADAISASATLSLAGTAPAEAVPVTQPALAVVVRDEETGAFLAREPVRPADLTGHMNEAWRDGCLRQGYPGISLTQLAITLRPIFKAGPRQAETASDPFEKHRAGPLHRLPSAVQAGSASGSASACAGFSLDMVLPTGRVATTSFTVQSLHGVAARAADQLVTLGKLRSGQTYTYEVLFQRHPVAAAVPPGPVLDFEMSDRSPALSWLETPLRPLLKQGAPQQAIPEHSFHVFFTAAAFARAEQFARRGASSNPPVETGAVLVGAPCSCPETGDFFVVVTDAYEVIGAEQKVFSLAYTDRSWNRIQSVLKARQRNCPALRLVGQAHGHNFLPAGGKTCEACPTRAVCDLTNIYASEDDQNWTWAVFAGAPYALCAIFGLSARADRIHGLFTQRDSRLRQRGYFILPEFNPEQWPCRTSQLDSAAPPHQPTPPIQPNNET